ncbi:Protein of unknown function [Propionibacterium freudenreichii]|nr:Protein of unknown function [Propionibacterium freudenreichii]CEI26418.1 Protein of unknown function [Propionibacterium freudenreichii]
MSKRSDPSRANASLRSSRRGPAPACCLSAAFTSLLATLIMVPPGVEVSAGPWEAKKHKSGPRQEV